MDEKDPNKFVAKMGAEALHDMLANLDLDELSYNLRHSANTETSQQRKSEALKRLQVVESFRDANSRIHEQAGMDDRERRSSDSTRTCVHWFHSMVADLQRLI